MIHANETLESVHACKHEIMISSWNAFNTIKIKRVEIKLPSNFKRGIDNSLLMGVTLDLEATNEDEMELFFVIHFK